MGTHGQVALADVFAMLKTCLPGWSKEAGVTETRHNLQIHYGQKTYRGFPAGQHGKRPGRAMIQKGHVKDLAAFFEIALCAKGELEILR